MSREDFEKWWSSLPLSYRVTFQTNDYHWLGWQARQPEIDALIREREEWIKKWFSTAEENAKLKQEIEDLAIDLNDCREQLI